MSVDKSKVLIQVQDLKKAFGSNQVLDGISTDICQGEVVAIIGPSGSGKSTFLRSLNLLEEPTGGKILFEGTDITDPKVDINRHRQKIGMASSGVHSNGFSLVRKVFEMTKESLDTYYDELGTTLGEALIAPTKIYVKALKSIKDAGVKIHACSHITGGGFYENVPRMLKEGTRAVIEKDSYPVLPIFKLLAKTGDIEEKMMYNTYNMGLGMVLAVDPADVDKTMEAIKAAGETPYVVGRIEAGEKGVTLC